MENMRYVFFSGGDAAGIFAKNNTLHFFRQLELDFFLYLFILDNVYRNIGIDEAEDIEVDGNGIVDLDDILAAQIAGTGVYHKGHRIGRLVQAQPVKNTYALPGFNMINNNSVPYLFDIKHLFLPVWMTAGPSVHTCRIAPA